MAGDCPVSLSRDGATSDQVAWMIVLSLGMAIKRAGALPFCMACAVVVSLPLFARSSPYRVIGLLSCMSSLESVTMGWSAGGTSWMAPFLRPLLLDGAGVLSGFEAVANDLASVRSASIQ